MNATVKKGKLSELIYQYRGYIPLPLLLIVLIWSRPSLWSYIIGTSILFLGESIRIWAAGYIQQYRGSKIEAEHLITGGPYAYIRNPLYLGNFFIGLGCCIISRLFFSFPLFILLYLVGYGIIIPREESYLEQKFGEEYTNYSHTVPRLIPRLKKISSPTGSFQWQVILTKEIYTIIILATIVIIFSLKR